MEMSFAVEHPAAQGHFPGNPIIPGAVLLDEVLQAIETSAEHSWVGCDIRSAKFLLPVRPGDRMLIRWNAVPSGETKFECLVQGQLVLTGSLKPRSK